MASFHLLPIHKPTYFHNLASCDRIALCTCLDYYQWILLLFVHTMIINITLCKWSCYHMPLSMLIYCDLNALILIAKMSTTHQHVQYAKLSHLFFISIRPLIWCQLQLRILCEDIYIANKLLSLMMMYRSFLIHKNTFLSSASNPNPKNFCLTYSQFLVLLFVM